MRLVETAQREAKQRIVLCDLKLDAASFVSASPSPSSSIIRARIIISVKSKIACSFLVRISLDPQFSLSAGSGRNSVGKFRGEKNAEKIELETRWKNGADPITGKRRRANRSFTAQIG